MCGWGHICERRPERPEHSDRSEWSAHMSSDVAARASLALSLAFHIVFAALGIGLPLMFCIAEGIGLRKRDATWYVLARRWSRAAGILFVVGDRKSVVRECVYCSVAAVSFQRVE